MSRRSRSHDRIESGILDVCECEQRRMGRDLHDGLCQELAGAGLLAKSMQGKLRDGGIVNPAEAAELSAVIRTALRHARGLARGLDPVAAEPQGLGAALQQLAVDTADAASVECAFLHSQLLEVADPRTAIHLYRIAQDAVWDAVREGRAAKIYIELRRNPDGLEMNICDDGIDGVSQPCAIRMMKYRARVIGATLKVCRRSDVARGKRVVCKLRDNKGIRGSDENHQTSRQRDRSQHRVS